MSTARIKTLVIATLLLINIFFLTIIIADTYANARNERQELENICYIMQSNGIRITPDCIGKGGTLRTMQTTRETGAEAKIARALLGNVEMTEQGGGIYQYKNPDNGTAEFYTAGYFEIQIEQGAIANKDGTIKTVQKLIREMDLETSTSGILLDQDTETVAVVSAYNGASIFNCTIEFVFTSGYLRTVQGRYVSGAEQADYGVGISQVGTALLGFLSSVSRGDIECVRIDGVEAGYQHNVIGSFGEGVIVPAWMIETDTGRYMVDSATGEIRHEFGIRS